MTPTSSPLVVWVLSIKTRIIASWNRAVRTEHGPYGNTIWRFGKQSYIQRSGHGAFCDARMGCLMIWADARTGRPFYIGSAATPDDDGDIPERQVW